MKKLLLSVATLALGFSAYAGEVIFDFTANNYGLPAYDENMLDADYAPQDATITNGDVKIVLGYTPQEGVEDGGWRMWTDGLRAYYKRVPYFTVSTTNGEKVTGVSWGVSSGATFALQGTDSNITYWDGEATTVTFVYTGTSNKAVQTITVAYGDDSVDPVPDVPTAPEGTITVAKALQLISDGYTGAATVEGVITEVDEINLEYGNATYTIKDNANDAEGLKVFRGKYLNGASFTADDVLEVGAKVVVTGNLINYQGTTPEFEANNYIVSYNGETGDSEKEGVIYSETFATSLGDFVVDNIDLSSELSYVWSFASGYGAKASAYVGGGNQPAVSRLVSPTINLAGYSSITLSFDHTINYANGATLTDLCQVYVALAGSNDWTNLSDKVVYPAGNNWTFVNSGAISLDAFAGQKVNVSFLYNSTAEVAPTWEIKNFVVEGTNTAGVENIDTDNAQAVYYNLQGVKVNNPVKGGLYIVRKGNKSFKTVIK